MGRYPPPGNLTMITTTPMALGNMGIPHVRLMTLPLGMIMVTSSGHGDPFHTEAVTIGWSRFTVRRIRDGTRSGAPEAIRQTGRFSIVAAWPGRLGAKGFRRF